MGVSVIAVLGSVGLAFVLVAGYLLHMGRTAGCQKSIVRRTYR
jgi:hypothetical protein